MNAEERIAHNEFLIYLNKEMTPMLKYCGQILGANLLRYLKLFINNRTHKLCMIIKSVNPIQKN